MAYTSWGTRKALGRRYSWDPAMLMEQERLEREYGLIPGREARGMQASEFAQTLAEREKERKQAAVSGMVGTAGNVLTTGAMLRAYTMEKGKPFFGEWGTKTTPGGTPIGPYQAALYEPGAPIGSESALGGMGTAGTTQVSGATLASQGLAEYGGQAISAYEAGGGGMGVGGAGAGMGMYAWPALAGYAGAKYGPLKHISGEMAFLGMGGEKEKRVGGGALRGAGAGAIVGTMIMPGVGTVVGTVIGAVVGGLTELFGW